MPRLLLADDNGMLLDVMGKSLQRRGFDVVSVSNGSQAIQALQIPGFDVLVTDFQMPEKTGYDVIAAAIASKYPFKLIILNTSWFGPEIDAVTEMMRHSFIPFLVVDKNLSEIVAKITAIL